MTFHTYPGIVVICDFNTIFKLDAASSHRIFNLKKLEKIKVPITGYDKQPWFSRLEVRVFAIQNAQANNQTELGILFSAILDCAFMEGL